MTDKYISYSQLQMYNSCQRKWYYQYYLDEELPVIWNEALIFGSVFHKAIDKYLQERSKEWKINFQNHYINTALLTHLINESISEETKDFRDEKRVEFSKKHYKTIFNFLKDALNILSKDAKEIVYLADQPAIETVYHSKDTNIRGLVDLIYIDNDDNVVLLDWKTSSYEYSDHDLLTSKQLLLYTRLVEEGNKVDIDEDSNIIKKYSVPLGIDKIAYCVLNKRSKSVELLKTPDYFVGDVFLDSVIELNEILELCTVHKSGFNRNPSFCLAYRSECRFYSKCFPGLYKVDRIDSISTL